MCQARGAVGGHGVLLGVAGVSSGAAQVGGKEGERSSRGIRNPGGLGTAGGACTSSARRCARGQAKLGRRVRRLKLEREIVAGAAAQGTRGVQRPDGSDLGGNRGCLSRALATHAPLRRGSQPASSPRLNGYPESMPKRTNQGNQRVCRLPADSDIQRCLVHCPADHIDVRRERQAGHHDRPVRSNCESLHQVPS